MMEHILIDSCNIVEVTRNRFGDRIYKIVTTEKCRFRVNDKVATSSHQVLDDTDAMLWLSSDTAAIRDSIIEYESTFYQIKEMIAAMRLGETEVQFYKCNLKIMDIAIS